MVTKVENLPDELKTLSQWVCWETADKVPKNPHTGGNARSNDQSTWGSFAEACNACEQWGFDGLGFMFANGYFGVDLDHCMSDVDFCDEFVTGLQSYAEVSRSGDGIHIICKGELPQGARRRGNVEMYSSGRYFICTGNVYNKRFTAVRDCTEAIRPLHRKYLSTRETRLEQSQEYEPVELDDRELIDKASSCKTGELFRMLYAGNWQGLYDSQSSADFAFCLQLAFWTQKNTRQMDRIFRSSGLYRRKWDEMRGQLTYGALTLERACAQCTDVYEPRRYDDDRQVSFSLFRDGKAGAEPVRHYDMTDTGNAHRLQDRFGEIIRYSYSRKKWMCWNGKVWEVDETGEVKKFADLICEDIKRDAVTETDEKTQTELLKWASKTASSRGKEAMVKECQHLPGIPILQDELDCHRYYLNCANGIVNLKNGELTPHDSSFMITKACTSEYDPYGEPPVLWLRFLDDITGGDKELQRYMQKCVGYSLTGSTDEQCAYFLYGVGNNGKSTFLDTLANIFGGYSANAQPETIMMKRWGNEGMGSDIARLKGTRFVTTEEPTEGVRLNEGLLKQLTGGSKVTCRFLYGEEFEYTPEFKIWVATNHKPVIRGTDVGIWRRIKLIPFEVSIPPDKVDKQLKDKLKAEYPKILKWAVDGCMLWMKEGIAEPACVSKAVIEYKQEMDLLAGFIDQCIEIDYSCKDKVPAKALFRAYLQWAKENNEYEMSSKKFYMEISKRLPDKGRDSKGVFYKFIKLVDEGTCKQYSFADFKDGKGVV